MRILVLFFPRLSVQLARRADATLAGRPLALTIGAGDAALVSGASCEATSDGVEAGMTVAQARQRCRALIAAPDNGSDCLDTLERLAAAIRTRVTPGVALLSNSALVVPLEGLETRMACESSAAAAILAFARSWSSLDIRGAVGSNTEQALAGARKARRHVTVLDGGTTTAAALPAYEPLSAAFTFAGPASQQEVEVRLARMAASLAPLMEAQAQSNRLIGLELEYGERRERLAFQPARPLHSAAEVLELLRSRLPGESLAGVTRLKLMCARPGPALDVAPWRSPVASIHQLSAPVAPVQRRLLRAS